MNQGFLDTSGLIALVNTDDQWHAAAETVWRELLASGARLVTTSLVLIELGDGLSRIQHRPLAIQIYDSLHAAERIEIVQTTSDHEEQAWQIFRQTDDKEWGITDCVSMIVMRDHDITRVFSSDHHFEQAGFEILVKP